MVFNPTDELIEQWFTDKDTIEFIQGTRKKVEEHPNASRLFFTKHPNKNDLDKIQIFLYLFGLDLYTCKFAGDVDFVLYIVESE